MTKSRVPRQVLLRRFVLSVAVGLACLLVPGFVFAHPLGNFTINHLSELRSSGGTLDLRYVLDMAEIPTFSVTRAADPSGTITPRGLAAWSASHAAETAKELDVTVDGHPVALQLVNETARLRPGAGGLPILYFVANYTVPIAAGVAHNVGYQDTTYQGRLGWRNVIVAPQTEPTHELLVYPNALTGSPPNLTSVAFSLTGSGAAHDIVASAPAPSGQDSTSLLRSNILADMLAKGTGDFGFVLLTLGAALILGALHALEPGHGKTLLAITLVGARATSQQALILAGSLTIAHTIGVIGLGIVILFFVHVAPEAIYPWLLLISGFAVAILGARALGSYVDRRRPRRHTHAHAHVHAHEHEHPHVHTIGDDHHAAHEHGTSPVHDHGDGHPHAHDELDDEAHALAHAVPGDKPLSFGSAVVAAMSGGIAPCPAALLVLLSSVGYHLVTYGLVLIVIFSFGLASTLTGLGIAVVRGAGWLTKRSEFDRFVRYAPLFSAVIIAAIGSWMVGEGFVAKGITQSGILVAGLTLLAILGYAFGPRHRHTHEHTHTHTAQTA